MRAPFLDKHGITELLTPQGGNDDPLKVQFRTAAQRFRLIDESGYRSILVRYGDSPVLLGRLQKEGPERWLMRKLQRYTVSLPEWQFQKLLANGDVLEIYPAYLRRLRTCCTTHNSGCCWTIRILTQGI